MKYLYYSLDSKCRERAYQTRILTIKAQNPQSRLLIVVGNSHKNCIEQALINPRYRTEIDPGEIDEFNRLVEEFKS